MLLCLPSLFGVPLLCQPGALALPCRAVLHAFCFAFLRFVKGLVLLCYTAALAFPCHAVLLAVCFAFIGLLRQPAALAVNKLVYAIRKPAAQTLHIAT